MADALMGWDNKQKRWRAMYKGRRLQIRAVDLGGTNYTDTLVAANQWFRQQQERIDRELALDHPRPNELAYIAELQSIQADIKPFSALVRNPTHSSLIPVLELLKHKETLLKRALQQDILPPLDDTLRNPRHISPERYEEEAAMEATQIAVDIMFDKDTEWVSYEEIEDTYDYDGIGGQILSVDMRSLVESTTERRKAEAIAGLQSELVRNKKNEIGLIDSEYVRGKLNQALEDQGVAVPESLHLDYHIERFIEVQRRKYAENKISAGRLAKIISTIDTYRKWSSLVRVDRIGTKEHIDGYNRFLSDKIVAGEIKGRYANNLFADFKMLIDWLFKNEVLKTYPVCLQRMAADYRFRVERQDPKTIPLKWVHQILDAAGSRMRLYILLTLNCGFGASEIGQLLKDEYDPKEGRIKHRRHKTEKYSNVPKVCYKLWDITKELLDREIAHNRKKYPKVKWLLVNNNGNPLWSEYVGENGKTHKSDNITTAFKRLISKLRAADPECPQVSYYLFRKTSASYIRNEHQFRTYNGLWLGHAPETMGDQAYNAMDDTILDACIAWLHGKIFGGIDLLKAEMVK